MFIEILLSTDLMRSQWLPVVVESVLGWLHCMDVGNVADILEVHAASIFRVQIYRVGEFLSMSKFMLPKIPEGRNTGGWWPIWVNRDSGLGRSCKERNGFFKGHGVHQKKSATVIPKWSPIQVLTKNNVATLYMVSIWMGDCLGTRVAHHPLLHSWALKGPFLLLHNFHCLLSVLPCQTTLFK
jgi:hypothetical protein